MPVWQTTWSLGHPSVTRVTSFRQRKSLGLSIFSVQTGLENVASTATFLRGARVQLR